MTICRSAAAKTRRAVIVAAGAADIAGAHGVLVAQRLWEERQAEELITHGICELLARRHVAEAIAGHENLNLRQHFEHHGHADLQLKHVVADVCTGYADGRHHGLNRVRDDRLIRNNCTFISLKGDNALIAPRLRFKVIKIFFKRPLVYVCL